MQVVLLFNTEPSAMHYGWRSRDEMKLVAQCEYSSLLPDLDALEDMFGHAIELFETHRSMCVGDVVVIHRDGVPTYYQCTRAGWSVIEDQESVKF